MTGETFELHVHDGNAINATKLALVNQWTGVNQAVTPSLSSGHEFYIRFRYSAGRTDARVKFLVMDDRGQSVGQSGSQAVSYSVHPSVNLSFGKL